MLGALRWAGITLALAAASFGGWTINQPTRPNGPFGFGVASPVGLLALVFGVVLLRAVARRPAIYGLAALLIAIFAGYNFFSYPPIPDGAYFLLRYGHGDAGELWPASATWHVIGFAGVAWTLTLALNPSLLKDGHGLVEAGLLVLLIAAGSVLLEWFTQTLPTVGTPRSWAAPWLAGLIVVSAGLVWLGRKSTFARLAAVFCALLSALTGGTLLLYLLA